MTGQVVRWAAATFLLSVATLVIALGLGGGAPQPAPVGIPDPGALTGWGLPVAKVLADALGCLCAGLLLTAVFLLPSAGDDLQGLAVRAVGAARRVALGWAVATVALFFLTVSDTFAVPLSKLSWSLISEFPARTGLGRALIAQVLVALVVFVLARWTVRVTSAAGLLGLALAGFVPQAVTGHSAASGSHDLAVVSLLVHLVGAALWVGGLAGLGWVALRGSRRLPAAVTRFSTLALWCVGMLAASGVVNAATRVGSFAALDTWYGYLVLGKVAAIVALAGFGLLHRRRSLPALQAAVGADSGTPEARRGRRAFLSVAAVELMVMAMTIALAVGLSRTPTPVPDDLYEGLAEELLGEPMPDPPSLLHLLAGWSPSGVGFTVVGFGIALYGWGLVIMHRRGDRWPAGRTASWFIGMAVVAWSTFGGLGQYSHVMFSAHMASHMTLSMVAPIFLVLGAPVTLALRTLPGPRGPGEVSPRQMLVTFLHSGVMRFLTHPLVAAALFTGSLYVLYFSPLFGVLMNDHLGHGAMQLHFLLVGCLYYYVIVGIDPSPRRYPPLVRFGLLMIVIPFHAFFAIAVMQSTTVFGESYFSAIERPFSTDLLADQYVGGGIAWAMGEVPLVLVMGSLFVQWIRSDRREARRFDRKESASDDADLRAYNDYLASLDEHGPRRNP